MDSHSVPKRCRASAEQLNFMADFMLENKGLAGGKFQKMHGKLETQKRWAELATTLNSLGGAVKSVDQWHNVWRDLKSSTSNKVRDWKKQQSLTGNKPINIDPITEFDKRIISLIGQEYVEGSGFVAENIPEAEELQLRLDEGEDISELFLNMPALNSSAKSTPQKSRKRKRSEDDAQEKLLNIAQQQAHSLKLLAESNAPNTEAIKMMADAIKIMGEGLKTLGEAFNHLAQSINKL